MNKHFTRHFQVIFSMLLIASMVFSGCSPASTPAPTLDPAVLVEQIVQTANAQLTADALANPSPTPLPTNTPQPSQTPTPQATATSAFTSTPEPSPVPALAAEFLYAATYPENKRIYVPNETFGLALGFKNIGSVPWSASSVIMLVNFSGEDTVDDQASSGKVVMPGDKVEFNLSAFGSELLGQHTWVFQLYTDVGPVTGGVGVFTYISE